MFEAMKRALKSNYLDTWAYVPRTCLQVIGRDNIALHCNFNIKTNGNMLRCNNPFLSTKYWLLSANQSLCLQKNLKAIYSPNPIGVTGLLQTI